MKPDEIIVLALTFLTGVVAGAFLYVMVYAPQYEAEPVSDRSSFSVSGEQYGGCQMATDACGSFRLQENLEYQYLLGDEPTEGRLPAQLYNDFANRLSTNRLQSHAAQVDRNDCSSFRDGVDYRYDIVFEGQRYRLDTCRTSLSSGSELQQSLLAIWEYLENPEVRSEYPVLIEDGVGGWLRSRMQGQ